MGHGEEAATQPRVTQEERERQRIDRIACFVARDPEGHVTEGLLVRLLRLTNNHRRWGFLSPDNPLNAYYHHRKVAERCRLTRRQAS